MYDDDADVIPGVARPKCLPTYIVLDTSKSMTEHTALLNESLKNVHRAAAFAPQVAAFAHMSIAAFNSEAHLVLPMTDINQVPALPRVACSGRTEYAKVFSLLRERIEIDVPALKAAGRRVLRPAVFFLTDGSPTDGWNAADNRPRTDPAIWRAALRRLLDPSWSEHPNILAFGVGSANASVLKEVATLQAFIAKDPANQVESLRKVFTTLVKTLTMSATNGQLNFPSQIDGFLSVLAEEM